MSSGMGSILQNASSNFVLSTSSLVSASWRVKFYDNIDNILNCLPNRPTSTKYELDRLPPFTYLRYF